MQALVSLPKIKNFMVRPLKVGFWQIPIKIMIYRMCARARSISIFASLIIQ